MTGPVVVGIDDFEHSEHLITVAAREAEQRGSALWLAHAYHGFAPVTQGVPPDYTPEEIVRDLATSQLTALVPEIRARHSGLHVETAVVTGPAAPALAVLADTASLLVVGGRGRGGLAGQLLGSVALRTLARAHCPVLVVRGVSEQATGRVMLGVDVDDPATGPEVVGFAFEEAALRNAGLYAFHAWEDPSILYTYGSQAFRAEQRTEALKRCHDALAEALAPWQKKYPEVSVTSEVLTGVPTKLLVESTQLVDLVVIGARARHDGEDGMRVGAIAHTVLHHAACPVAVVPDR
ncbi:universal stress protein [Catenulispora subtropica]|uniref:Universal stress protein n=1 Tax=Catenulispora subtropica TaxID=450798 RepID=A0ABN2TAJ2_9ACTN